MTRGMKIALGLVTAAILVLPIAPGAQAGVGTGITTFEIVLDKPLESGQTHDLQPVGIMNTGDVRTSYGIRATYLRGQKQLHPDPSWFSFEPRQVTLEPSMSASFKPRLSLPVGTKPGKYFALLQAYAGVRTKKGAAMSSAAATKLTFKVIGTNPLRAIWNKILDFLQTYAPWSYAVLAFLAVAVVTLVVLRQFEFSIKRRKHPDSNDSSPSD